MSSFHQIDILEPVAEAAKQFTNDYKCFASAVDTTRHYLPVKNFHVDGEGRQFLGSSQIFSFFHHKSLNYSILFK